MPYIIARRAEVQNGSVQITDLFPNQSQANPTIDPAPQGPFYVRVPNMGLTGYTKTALVELADGSISFARESHGLVAYLVKNIQNVAGGGTIAITVAEGVTIATAILTRARNGQTLTADALNAILVAALGAGNAIDAGNSSVEVEAVLNILAGESYVVAGGYSVQTAAGDHVAVLADSGLGSSMRRLVERDTSWQVSFNEGVLAGLVANQPNGFAGNAATTPLVAVYNADGTVYAG